MLAVPARTANLSASWSMSGWFTSVSATRAFDWVNYDRLALAQEKEVTAQIEAHTRPPAIA